MTKTETIAIIIICTLSSLALAAVAMLIGHTKELGDMVADWLQMSVTTSALILFWTWTDRRKKNKQH